MVLMAMSMLLFLPGIYVFNGLANIFFIIVHKYLFLTKQYSYLPVKVKSFSRFYVFTCYRHVPCFKTTLIIYY